MIGNIAWNKTWNTRWDKPDPHNFSFLFFFPLKLRTPLLLLWGTIQHLPFLFLFFSFFPYTFKSKWILLHFFPGQWLQLKCNWWKFFQMCQSKNELQNGYEENNSRVKAVRELHLHLLYYRISYTNEILSLKQVVISRKQDMQSIISIIPTIPIPSNPLIFVVIFASSSS